MIQKSLFVLAIVFFSVGSTQAQSQRQKERFAKRLFKDFKNGHLDLVEDLFVDQYMLEKLLKTFDEEGGNMMSEKPFEEIDAERKKARKKLSRSLNRAYDKLEEVGSPRSAYFIESKFKAPRFLRNKTIDFFSTEIIFELNNKEYALVFSMNFYDNEDGLFYLMDEKVRLKESSGRREMGMLDLEESADIDEVVEAAAEEAVAEAVEEAESVDEVDDVSGAADAATEAVEAVTEAVEEAKENLSPPPPPPPPRIRSKEENEKIFQIVEQMPEFPGGEQKMYEFMANNLEYPRVAQEHGITGMVIISFVVNTDGSLTSCKISRDIGGGCGQAALKTVRRMPKWKPGKQNGQTVRVQYELPVSFRME